MNKLIYWFRTRYERKIIKKLYKNITKDMKVGTVYDLYELARTITTTLDLPEEEYLPIIHNMFSDMIRRDSRMGYDKHEETGHMIFGRLK